MGFVLGPDGGVRVSETRGCSGSQELCRRICTDPNYPFCDEGGEISGSAKTCVAVS